MINLSNKKECCGCGACIQSCPVKAIKFKKDDFGFFYPNIDKNICIDCNKCKKVCLFRKKIDTNSNYEKDVYVAVATNVNVAESSSGGIFSSIAQTFLEEDNLVCGCEFIKEKDNFECRHIIIDNIGDLKRLKGSKYIQSNLITNNIYKQIEDYLIQGKKVLFSGTPCQVGGLKGYLRKEYNNLYCIEILCHGVPSSQIFNDYIKNFEQEKSCKVIEYKFRDNFNIDHSQGSLIVNSGNKEGVNGKIYFTEDNSSYYHYFLRGTILRESCFSCKYSSKNRAGDITIGDYWNLNLVHPEYTTKMNIKEGVSVVIINNDKGKELLDHYGLSINYLKSSYENVSKYNRNLLYSTEEPKDHKRILNLYKQKGYFSIEEEFKKTMKQKQTKRLIKNKIKKLIKK